MLNLILVHRKIRKLEEEPEVPSKMLYSTPTKTPSKTHEMSDTSSDEEVEKTHMSSTPKAQDEESVAKEPQPSTSTTTKICDTASDNLTNLINRETSGYGSWDGALSDTSMDAAVDAAISSINFDDEGNLVASPHFENSLRMTNWVKKTVFGPGGEEKTVFMDSKTGKCIEEPKLVNQV